MHRQWPVIRCVFLAALLAGCEEDGSPVASTLGGPAFDAVGGGLSGRIAFVRGGVDAGMYVMNADGTGATRVATNAGWPTWSPDGRRIAFSRFMTFPNVDIWVMNADGSGQINLTNSAASDFQPAWSSDGTRIAFPSNRDGRGIYVMNVDGTGMTRVTTGDFDQAPVWSPDGTRIAFEVPFENEIYVVNADGSGRTNLTNSPLTDSAPAWSPDGKRIAFIRRPEGQSGEIFSMRADGTGATQITTHGLVGSQQGRLAWSPDGNRIAYDRADDRIFVVRADGKGATELAGSPSLHPAWTARQ